MIMMLMLNDNDDDYDDDDGYGTYCNELLIAGDLKNDPIR